MVGAWYEACKYRGVGAGEVGFEVMIIKSNRARADLLPLKSAGLSAPYFGSVGDGPDLT